MESIALCLLPVALIGVGCAATIVSAYLVPLSVRQHAQLHGRFCWLPEPLAEVDRGSRRKAGETGWAVRSEPIARPLAT